MTEETFQVHPQLAADSHGLFDWRHCHVRLHHNASLPWVIIIPRTEIFEFHDLPIELQTEVTHISQQTSDFFKTKVGSEKINFAAIGNVVKQLHIHVIGRHHKDPLWPDVVWGKELPKKLYNRKAINDWADEIEQKVISTS